MELTPELLKVVKKWSAKTESAMKRILSSKGKGNSRLYKQLKLIVRPKQNSIEISTGLPDYAVFVDKGRHPGKQPPLKSIIAWCKSKGIEKSAAFPIARKIGERGIKPTNFMKPFSQFRDLIEELTKTAVVVIKEDIKENIKKK